MAKVSETMALVDSIVRLRRAERVPEAADDVAPVRRSLERQVGPTLSRSRAARVLGVSQTALDRWVECERIPVVIGPSGRKEVPRQVVVEVREAVDRIVEEGIAHRPLAAALAERDSGFRGPSRRFVDDGVPPDGHRTAARRSLAYHQAIADRLDERLVADASDRVDELEEQGHLDPRYASPWREILARPIATIADAIVADTESGNDLRQSSPFAGVLNEHERRRIIETVR